MAKGIYVGGATITNMIGSLGDMESGTAIKTTAEAAYVKNSSQHKFGSGSQAFQQSASATTLTYVLRDSSGVKTYNFNSTHKYYFSCWINQRTSLAIGISVTTSGSTSVLSSVKNTALNTWEQHSAIFTPSSNGNNSISIICNDYPGSNALANFDGLMLVDLTACFGSGREPNIAWCDANISFTTGTLSSVARKVKQPYIGVSDVARKVVRAYVGVNGVAKLFFTDGIPANYLGTATNYGTSARFVAGASTASYAIFHGGNSSGYTNRTEAYNSSLTKKSCTASAYRSTHAAGTVGNYAVFAGGYGMTTSSGTATYFAGVDAYNDSLTKSTATDLSVARRYLANASVGDYTVFAGGYNGSASSTVNAYNSSLTMTTPTVLSKARYNLAGASVGDYALFAAGVSGSSAYTTVNAYNSSLTRSTPTSLGGYGSNAVCGASTKSYALFVGNMSTSASNGNAYAYNSSLTRTTAPTSSSSRCFAAGIKLGDGALIAGGYYTNGSTNTLTNSVDYYDNSLTKWALSNLSVERTYLAAAAVGKKALILGGGTVDGNTKYNAVDVYQYLS